VTLIFHIDRMNQQNIYYIKTYRKNLHNIRRNSREILFCPLAAFLFTLTSLLIINIINKNILNVDAAKRRLCGPRLTSELWRVCTKAGN